MMRSVLFVCTGNLCRSPMAATLFAAHAAGKGRRFDIASAGVAACVGEPPPAPIVSLMAALGLDVSSHRAQQFTGELAKDYDLVLVMEAPQQRYIEENWVGLRGRVRRLGEWRDEDILDPYGRPMNAYEDCLSHIEVCLNDWQERLLT